MKCPEKVRQGYIQDAGEYGPSGFMTSILSNRTFHPTNEDYVQSGSPQQRLRGKDKRRAA